MGWGTDYLLVKQNALIEKQNELLEQQAQEARRKRIEFFGEEEVLRMEEREKERKKAEEEEIILPKKLEEMSETEAGIRLGLVLGLIVLCIFAALK